MVYLMPKSTLYIYIYIYIYIYSTHNVNFYINILSYRLCVLSYHACILSGFPFIYRENFFKVCVYQVFRLSCESEYLGIFMNKQRSPTCRVNKYCGIFFAVTICICFLKSLSILLCKLHLINCLLMHCFYFDCIYADRAN